MRILVRVPNWLGDAVMCTPALDNLLRQAPGSELVLVGPPAILELFRGDPRGTTLVADDSKSKRFRFLRLNQLARQVRQELGPFELAFTFKNSLSARWFSAPCRPAGGSGSGATGATCC